MIPVDENGETLGDGVATIQFITDRGKLNGQFTYYLPYELAPTQTESGWYNDADEYAEYTFASGESFQIFATEGMHFLHSGAVVMAETDVPFRKNLSFQANIRPMSIDIQKITPVDDNGELIGDGDVTIQIFTDRGKLSAQYTYYLPQELAPTQTQTGWFDDADEYAEKEFVGGEGFKLFAVQSGYLRFPEL